MSQNDFVIADQTFPATLADLNAAFQALASASAGAAAPGTTYAYQLWADSANALLKMRNGANTAWLTLAKFDTVNDRWELRSDVLQALSASGLVLRDAAGVALATLTGAGIYLNSGLITLRNAAGTETLASFSADGGAYLRYDNVNRIWTTAAGATVFGTLQVDKIAGGTELGNGGFFSYAADLGTKSSGTFTPTVYSGNFQRLINGGPFTLAAPTAAGDYFIVLRIVNNASAGAITLSGFTKVYGDPFTTSDGKVFLVTLVKVYGTTTATVQAMP